ncbi:hypothetical protein V6N11_074241 [Hibiscus sabdariffa]|uniref:QWRF motif-containing protein 2 n=1 Tax=Hibiscus sabdariffa TaxID=183260 RepID=A0ABR2NJY6_9ROSI
MVLVVAISATVNSKWNGGSRPLLLPSDFDNTMAPRRLKSRYLSTSSSSTSSTSSSYSSEASTKRFPSPSPSVSRTSSHSATITMPRHAASSTVKRSQSVGRRSAGDSFSYQFSEAKPSPSPARKGTPKRRKPMATTNPGIGTDQMENSKTERWPARIRQPDSMTRSMDCTGEMKKLNGFVNNNVVRALQNSLIDNRNLAAIGSEVQSDLTDSDTESVSSVCTSGALESPCNGNGDVKRGPQGIILPTRLWQETTIRLCLSDSGLPVFRKTKTSSKLIEPDKFGIDSPLSSLKGVMNSRQQLSPIRGPVQPASPSKLGASLTSSPSRGMSPSRVRNGLGGSLVNTPSILSFAGDVIKMGKIGENKVSNAHLLRLLHNSLLQWRFVNAKSDVVLSSQRSDAEMIFLDKWALLDHDYCSSLSGATEALKASTLRLSVICGARVDVLILNDAICSAVDVMQAMASSICSLLPRVAELNSLVAELENLSANEFVLLNWCKELLSTIAAMQVTECSMRTHISQLNRLPSGLIKEL